MTKLLADRVFRSARLELRASALDAGDKLPDGVCGRVTGVALVYNVADDYGTVFMPGCVAKTRAEKVAQLKVKIFADHGPYTETHVGVLRSLDDVGDTAVATFDLFDTESGQAMKAYLEAVIASGAETGLSIGFRPRDKEWRKTDGGDMCLFYKEIELREISITPVPAIPGTDVTSVRREPGESDSDLLHRALKHILMALPESDARTVFDTVYTSSATPADPAIAPSATPSASPAVAVVVETPTLVTEADRIRTVREAFATL